MRFISFLFIILFVFPVFSNKQYSPDISLYEACNWKNNAYTQRVIDETSNYCTAGSTAWPACLNKELLLSCRVDPFQISDFSQIKELQKTVMTDARIYTKKDNEIPKACFLASAVMGLNQYPPETSSYQYCHSSKSYETCKSMTFKNKKLKEEICNPNQPPNKSNIRNRPPCLDDRYIDLTAKVFNKVADCFDFTNKKDKERLFALFHHESRFLLNKIEEPPCTQSCRVKQNGEEKCNMDCQRKKIASGEVKSTAHCFGQLHNKTIKTLNQYINFPDDPAFRNILKYPQIYESAEEKCPFLKKAVIPSPSSLEGTSLWPTDTFFKAHDPFKENIICKTSQDPYSCLFYSIYNIKVNLQSISNILENSPDINTINLVRNKNTLLFNEEKMKWAFSFYAHNGGLNSMKPYFPLFIKDFKSKITNPESNKSCKICEELSSNKKEDSQQCKSCEKYLEYRNTLLSGKSLNINVLYNEFGEYINENKERFGDPDQLHDFVPNIISDLSSFSNQKGILKQALDNLIGNNDSPENQEKEIFLDFIKRNCPATL